MWRCPPFSRETAPKFPDHFTQFAHPPRHQLVGTIVDLHPPPPAVALEPHTPAALGCTPPALRRRSRRRRAACCPPGAPGRRRTRPRGAGTSGRTARAGRCPPAAPPSPSTRAASGNCPCPTPWRSRRPPVRHGCRRLLVPGPSGCWTQSESMHPGCVPDPRVTMCDPPQDWD